ncbi:MAG: pyrroline-5-carboxylate reductase [Polyangiales bacterium]
MTANTSSPATYAFIGGGFMAGALIDGLIHSGTPAAHIHVAELRQARRAELQARHPGLQCSAAAAQVVRAASVVTLAVKPGHVAAVLPDIAAALRPETVVISIAAGCTLARLQADLPAGQPLVRAMPNVAASVRQAVTALAPATSAAPAHMAAAAALFGAVGQVVQVSEGELDAVTGLSGSGPAYVCLLIEALSDGGVTAGLSRGTAQQLAVATVAGAAALLQQEGTHPALVRESVTSPGGTTAAGLHALEQGRLRATVTDAVLAATARARALR